MNARGSVAVHNPKVNELITFFRDFNISITSDDLLKPTPSSFFAMLSALCAEAYGINPKTINHLSYQELDFFSDPNFFDSFAQRGKVYAYTKLLFENNPLDFNIGEFTKPESDRVIKIVNAFMQFLKFKSTKLSAYREIVQEIGEASALLSRKREEVQTADGLMKEKESHVHAVRENVQKLRSVFEERSASVRNLQDAQRQILNKERDTDELLQMRRVQVEQLQEDNRRISEQIDYHKKLIAPDATHVKKEKARLEAQRQDMAGKIALQKREVSDIARKMTLITKCIGKLAKRQASVGESLSVISDINRQEQDNKQLAVNDEEKVRDLQQLTLNKEELMSRIDSVNRDLLLIQENHRARLEFVEGQLSQAQGLLEQSKQASASVLQQEREAQQQREKIERETEEKVNSIQRRIGEMEQLQASLSTEIQNVVRKVTAALKNSNGTEPVNASNKLFASARPIFESLEGMASPKLFPSPARLMELPTMASTDEPIL